MKQLSRSLPLYLSLFAALTLAALLPLRLWQQLYLVESTGFWVEARNPTVYALYAGLALLFALPAALAYACRKQTQLDLGRRRRLFEGVFALLVAAALLIDAYEACRFAVQVFKNYGVNALEPDYETLVGFQYFTRTGTFAALAESLFGTLGAVFFANLFLVDSFPGKNVYLNRLTALAPLLWAVCRLLRCFSRTISYLRISDLFLDLLMLTAMMVFFLAFAQIVSGINHEGKAPRLLATGIPAAVLAFLTFIPRVAVYSSASRAAAQPQEALIELCSPALALFILAFLLGRVVPAAAPAVQQQDSPQEDTAPAQEEVSAGEEQAEEAPQPDEPEDCQEDDTATAFTF